MNDDSLARCLRWLAALGLLGLVGWGVAALNRLSNWVAVTHSPGVSPSSGMAMELQENWMIAVNWCLMSLFLTAASLAALAFLREGRMLTRADMSPSRSASDPHRS